MAQKGQVSLSLQVERELEVKALTLNRHKILKEPLGGFHNWGLIFVRTFC